jgi:hypothetical protein
MARARSFIFIRAGSLAVRAGCGFAVLAALFLYHAAHGAGGGLDFNGAVIITPENADEVMDNTAALVVREVGRRAGLQWRVTSREEEMRAPRIYLLSCDRPADGMPAEASGLAETVRGLPPDSYGITTVTAESGNAQVYIVGKDDRGALFGAGCLLRRLRMGVGQVVLPGGIEMTTSPRHPIRGIQLGYRSLSNCYGLWSPAEFGQQIADLAVFGCNTIELVGVFDRKPEAGAPLPPLEMLVATSRMAASHGLDVCVWYPVLEKDYAREECVARTLAHWEEVCQSAPRIDALFVPGGDPGHTPPELLFPLVSKMADVLKKHHRAATVWISPQSFNKTRLDYFFDYINNNKPGWLTGVVSAPWTELGAKEIRGRLDKRYALRSCTDIGHVIHCQNPAENLDTAHAITSGREPVCPRPKAFAKIMREEQRWTSGGCAYSDGCNDDVNKIVWTRLGWEPDLDPREILLEYERYFIGTDLEGKFADGLAALESNTDGVLRGNKQVRKTYSLFKEMERKAGKERRENWRFGLALYRACFDYYTQLRLEYETDAEARAMAALREAGRSMGAEPAMREAESILDRAVKRKTGEAVRRHIFAIGAMLNRTIHFKLSEKLYGAHSYRRGATLDTIDWPLNNREWLKTQFQRIRKLPDERARCGQLQRMAHWDEPGPGGFYDDFGRPGAQGRVLAGGNAATAPHITKNWMRGRDFPAMRISWMDHVAAYGGESLRIKYENLDRRASYEITVVYGETKLNGAVRLTANGRHEIHPFLKPPEEIGPLSFAVPVEAVAEGLLILQWERPPDQADIDGVCHVSEIWLRKKTP